MFSVCSDYLFLPWHSSLRWSVAGSVAIALGSPARARDQHLPDRGPVDQAPLMVRMDHPPGWFWRQPEAEGKKEDHARSQRDAIPFSTNACAGLRLGDFVSNARSGRRGPGGSVLDGD